MTAGILGWLFGWTAADRVPPRPETKEEIDSEMNELCRRAVAARNRLRKLQFTPSAYVGVDLSSKPDILSVKRPDGVILYGDEAAEYFCPSEKGTL